MNTIKININSPSVSFTGFYAPVIGDYVSTSFTGTAIEGYVTARHWIHTNEVTLTIQLP